jgi:hypothetical protein
MALELSSTTKAKIAAAALTALSATTGAFSANAQQMAAVQPNYSRCDQMAQAGNHVAASQCRVDTLQAHTRQLQDHSRQMHQQTAEADRAGQCGRELSELKARDPSVLERGRAILAGRPAAEYGVCNLLAALRRG